MKHFEMAATVACMLAALGGGPAVATDLTLPGSKLLLQGVPGHSRLSLVSKTLGVLEPAPGGPDDPTRVGGSLMVYNPTSGESATFNMPASNWSVTPSGSQFKFVNRNAPAPPSEVKIAVLKNTKVLKVGVRSSGITLDEPSQGSLGVVLSTGSRRYCTLFGGTVIRDQVGKFAARNAPAPASCPPAPATTTTTGSTSSSTATTASSTSTSPSSTSTTTSTTAPPACGGVAPSCSGSCPVGKTCSAGLLQSCACR